PKHAAGRRAANARAGVGFVVVVPGNPSDDAGSRRGGRTTMPAREELPSTLRRSPKKAQETWIKAHDSAVETYGEGERSHRTAFAALKHSFEKVGDHWEPKSRRGPSDTQAAKQRPRGGGRTAEGVAANASKAHLYELAKRLDVKGRSSMTKSELVEAIRRANERQTRQTRRSRE